MLKYRGIDADKNGTKIQAIISQEFIGRRRGSVGYYPSSILCLL